MNSARLLGAFALVTSVAGCMETGAGSAIDGDGLSGTQAQFDSMEQPCLIQASRLTGTRLGSVTILDEIRTGGGPILTLDADGVKYTCRLENDGSVTVFSEFAN